MRLRRMSGRSARPTRRGGEDGGKFFGPVEGTFVDGGVCNEGVAADDVLGEIGQSFAFASGANPQCELSDFYRFQRKVNAKEVVGEDVVGVLLLKGGGGALHVSDAHGTDD